MAPTCTRAARQLCKCTRGRQGDQNGQKVREKHHKESVTNHCFSRLVVRRPMRRHMGTSSTTKGCRSPAHVHYFNTVSSPDVSPGGRKAALWYGMVLARRKRVWHLRAKMQARTKQKHTLAHAPGTSKTPLLAPAQCTAPETCKCIACLACCCRARPHLKSGVIRAKGRPKNSSAHGGVAYSVCSGPVATRFSSIEYLSSLFIIYSSTFQFVPIICIN